MAHLDLDTTDPGGWKQSILTIAVILWNQIEKDPASAVVVVLMVIFWCFRLFRQIQKWKAGKELAQKELQIKDEELKHKKLQSEEYEVNLQNANEKLQITLIQREQLKKNQNNQDDV